MYVPSRTCSLVLCLTVAVVVLVASSLATAQWQTQQIASGIYSSPSGALYAAPAIAFDGQDRPNVAYAPGTSGTVKHACGNTPGVPGNWTILNTGISSSLGTIHLAIADDHVYVSLSWYLFVGTTMAVFDGTTWQSYSPPGIAAMNTWLCGMATDTTGKVNWIFSMPLTSGTSVGYNLLRQTDSGDAVDVAISSGLPHGGTLSGGSASDILFAEDGDMTFDGSGNIHTIQYYQIGSPGFLLYAKGPATGPFTVDDNVDMGWCPKIGRPSIAVDAANKPHIVYTADWPYYRVNYLTQTASGWQHQTIDANGSYSGYVGTFPKILIDAKQTVHVIYADTLYGQVKHAKLVGDQWQIEVIDTVGTQASYTVQVGALSAAMDSTGGIGVVYWSGSEAALKYAYLAP